MEQPRLSREYVLPVRYRAWCECGGEMKPTGVAAMTNPAQYHHACKDCGATADYANTYPLIQYEVSHDDPRNAHLYGPEF